jgi:hypothetical protein
VTQIAPKTILRYGKLALSDDTVPRALRYGKQTVDNVILHKLYIMIILQICTIVSRFVFISVGSEDCVWCGNFKTGS